MNTIPVSMIGEVMNCKKSDNSNLYIGLCGTMFVGSDSYAVVITEVISPKEVRVADMLDEDYNSEKITDENGCEYIPAYRMPKYAKVTEDLTKFESIGEIYKLRKNGRWIKKGCGLWETGGVHFGHSENYRDPNF